MELENRRHVREQTGLVGKTFGRLTAIRPVEIRNHIIYWLCRCECSKEAVVASRSLRSGNTKSCGCLNREKAAERFRTTRVTHGFSGSPTYHSWCAMKQRCTYKNHEHYHLYGGVGVKVCDRWKRFENFLADMGERPEGKTLGRINDVGNYEPGNCEWQSLSEQRHHQKNKQALVVAA